MYMRYMRQFLSMSNAAGAAALFSAYTALMHLLLPEGVSRDFSQAASGYGAGVLIILLAIALWRGKAWKPIPQEKFTALHAVFLLLPLAPVVQYAALNYDILGVADAFWFIAIHAVIAGVFILLISFLLWRKVYLPVSISLSTALVYLYFNMAVLAHEWHWIYQGQFLIQISVFAITFAALLLLYPLYRQLLVLILGVFFLSHTALAVWNAPYVAEWRHGAAPVSMEFPYEQALKSGKPEYTPDIYLLVFDAYVPQEVMKIYGIDNSAQEAFLEANGFRLYPETYSTGTETMTSIPRLLNMTDVPRARQNEVAAGHATALRVLKSYGYETYSALGAYWFHRYDSGYDDLPGVWSKSDVRSHGLRYLLQASAEGQFRFNIGNSGDIGMAPRIEKKRQAVALETSHPKFLYSHTGPSHSQNSGRCLSDETARFEERLHKSNVEMREDIEGILNQNRDAIIIVMGDHGPHLTGNCYVMDKDYQTDDITREHLQDRLGAFMAIRWPERYRARAEALDLNLVQNLFHVVFAVMTDDAKVMDYRLPAKSFDSVAGVTVENGLIRGGENDGEPLFINR